MEVSQDVIRELCENDPRFLKLYEQHRLLEQQLQTLDQCTFLTPDQERERKTIQKMKLSAKDEMNHLMRVL